MKMKDEVKMEVKMGEVKMKEEVKMGVKVGRRWGRGGGEGGGEKPWNAKEGRTGGGNNHDSRKHLSSLGSGGNQEHTDADADVDAFDGRKLYRCVFFLG